jgi:homoserine dehydrogenase
MKSAVKVETWNFIWSVLHPLMAPLRIGLAGFGTVGSGLWRNLHTQASLLEARCARRLTIEKIATRTPAKALDAGVPAEVLVTHWTELVAHPELEVIVELIGGLTEARTLIEEALRSGKHVVTANKALLATYGSELFELAAQQNRHLLFEASVAGGIPIIKALGEGLVANRILTLHGIINGTCNYMLTQMSARGLTYEEALREAKDLGYAEADESLDVEGHDTAHKACILARLAYGFWPCLTQVHTQGIVGLAKVDVQYAHQLGYEVKLLAIIKADGAEAAEVRVHPTLVPQRHVLASVNGVFNAVLVRGDVVGDALFYGRGAGSNPTASAVISDLVELAQRPGCPLMLERPVAGMALKAMPAVTSRYYLRLMVEDRPGVLAEVATILARRRIGISSVIQPEGCEGDTVPLIFMVHDAIESDFCAAQQEINRLECVKVDSISLRVEDFN